MKRILNLIMFLSAFAAVSCELVEDGGIQEPLLEVNANNISGQWQLMQWNENTLNDDTYVYIDIVRNDRTYTMYQNIDSFKDVPHKVTGSYYIEVDPAIGAVIRGNYDHDSGDWAHRYIIRELTADEMYWVAKDNADFVQKFVRVDEIPVE
jgi:hypothetical protein